MCIISFLHFFALLWLLFKALLEIKIAFQKVFLREKLMFYKKQVLEGKTYFNEVLQKRASKTRFFFLITIFEFYQNFSKISSFKIVNIFRCKMILCAIYQKCIFCVFVALFWSTSWNRNCTPNNVFKRKTYVLQKTSFGRQDLFSWSASKKGLKNTIFFWSPFLNFLNIFLKFQILKLWTFSAVKWFHVYHIIFAFFAFLWLLFKALLEIEIALQIMFLREKIMF